MWSVREIEKNGVDSKQIFHYSRQLLHMAVTVKVKKTMISGTVIENIWAPEFFRNFSIDVKSTAIFHIIKFEVGREIDRVHKEDGEEVIRAEVDYKSSYLK